MVFDCNNTVDYTCEPTQLIFYFVIFIYNEYKNMAAFSVFSH